MYSPADPPSDRTAAPLTDPTIAVISDPTVVTPKEATSSGLAVTTPSGSTVATQSDLTVAPPTDPTVATPNDPAASTLGDLTISTSSGSTVATPYLSGDTNFWRNSAIVLLAILAAACLLALAIVLTFRIMRSRRVLSRPETDQQAASETERRPSDGYEVLPEDRISGDYELIEEDRRLSGGYESILNEDVLENMFCNRRVSSSSHYQTISLENLRTSPKGASAVLQIVSKSCGDLASVKVDSFEHADDKKASTEQEPEPSCSTHGRQTSEEDEQPRPKWFMLRDPTDFTGPFAGAFYSIDAEQSTELKDFITRRRRSADADGEGEYLTVLDCSREHADYLELIADWWFSSNGTQT
ncbi:hypothetical protein PoB_004394700 [Plakobranchus ocellatus]|uniref:Uncharacterized protein n=1 Tax=Plakobranchus ocellatus TaxID=259542 RepID=A0AAV4BE33_9GAST|nr:hypothetical protein PoB_004394700 [Plakobranchus ocellatus]